MVRILGLVAGYAFGAWFPVAGVLLGGPLFLLGVVCAAFRWWKTTLLLGVLLYLNHQHNTGGPAYVPPAELAAEITAARAAGAEPPVREPPRPGALRKAREAVEAEVKATLVQTVSPGPHGLEARTSLRNPSAFAAVTVNSLNCSAYARDGISTGRQGIGRRVPPGSTFEHLLRFDFPYPGRHAVIAGTRCEVLVDVHLP